MPTEDIRAGHPLCLGADADTRRAMARLRLVLIVLIWPRDRAASARNLG